MNYKYNELDYAKKVYEHGFQSEERKATELRLLATYMRRYLDYKPKKLREEMYHWCESHIIGYKQELYYKMVQSAITKACQKGSILINIDGIDFHQHELDYLENLNIAGDFSYECKKLLFTLLFQMKLNKEISLLKNSEERPEYHGKYFKGDKRKYNELKKIAKLSDKVKLHEDIIHALWQSDLITPLYSGLIRLDFMEDIYQLASNVAEPNVLLRIRDFESVGWYYDYYQKDKKIIFCKCCGKIFKKRSNREIYCSDECKKFIKNEKNKSYTKNICSE